MVHQSFLYNALAPNQLAQERCILYMACSTGLPYMTSWVPPIIYNLVDDTYQKGAHFVLGTTYDIPNTPAIVWEKAFHTRAGSGYKIIDCISYASNQPNSLPLSAFYYLGDEKATLKVS